MHSSYILESTALLKKFRPKSGMETKEISISNSNPIPQLAAHLKKLQKLQDKSSRSRPLAGTTRLELANQLIENQPAFHFAFIPVIVVRVERFELITKLVLSQPPLPIGLHAQIDLNWYSREDSNL